MLGTVIVAVNATGNTPPVMVNDTLVVAEDAFTTANSVYALQNDSDPNADKLKTIMAVGLAANGTSSFFIGRDLTMTVAPGQVGGHMLFDWNCALNIDLVNVWAMDSVFGDGLAATPTDMIRPGNCGNDCGATTTDAWSGVRTTIWDGASTDDDGDGTPGVGFVDGPFFDFDGNFNFMGLRPVVAPTAAAG